jgi:hypothetical protein
MSSRFVLVIGSALFALPIAGSAHAQADSTAAAEALFEDGRTLYEAGKYAEGCPKLAESYRLDAATGTLLALALCREGEGKLATAWAKFRDAEGRARQEGREDRAQVASDRAAALRPRLSTLAVDVPPEIGSAPGFEVRVDGVVIGAGMFGVPVPVDGGEHRIEASAPGRKPWQKLIAVKSESDAVRVKVEPLGEGPDTTESAPIASPDPAPVAPSPPPVSPSPVAKVSRSSIEPRSSGLGTQDLLGYVATGAGVVGLGVGLGFYLKRNSKLTARDSACPAAPSGGCPSETKRLEYETRQSEAVSAARTSTVFVVAGSVLAAGGVALILTAPREDSTLEQATLTPSFWMNGAGLSAEGRW